MNGDCDKFDKDIEKGSIEESQARNTKLTSAAEEELEMSKKELRSLTEKLITVNQELNIKIEELRQSNDDFQNLINSTDIGTIFLDRAFNIKSFTPAAGNLFSLTPADSGRPLTEIDNNLEYADLHSDLETVLENQQNVEHEIRSTDGNWYFMRLLPYRTIEDRIKGIILTFVNTTADKQSRETNLRLGEIIESTDMVIISTDFDGEIQSWNPAAERAFGYSADEAIGQNISILHAPEFESEEDEIVKKIKSGESIINLETTRIAKDGKPVSISITASPVRNTSGQITGISRISRDISERKEVAERLRESEQKYRSLFDEMGEAFALCELISDEAGNPSDVRILEVNAAHEQITGRSSKRTVGRTVRKLFPDLKDSWLKTCARVPLSGETVDFEEYLPKLNRWFHFRGFKIGEAGDGKFALIYSDITNRKENENYLLRFNEKLEQRVNERTSELYQMNENLQLVITKQLQTEKERVQLLKKLVTAQEDERRRLSRDLHDQLGQQLTALLLTLESVKSQCQGKKNLLSKIEDSQKIAKQIDSELSYIAWELRPTVLDDLGLEAALNNHVSRWSKRFNIRAEFQSTNVREIRLAGEIETNLYRIAQEALNNIIKHAEADFVEVLLERGVQNITLIIADNGQGFDPETEENSTSEEKGIGLIGMRERAAHIGGTIEIESETKKGTTVFVRVPINPASMDNGEQKDG